MTSETWLDIDDPIAAVNPRAQYPKDPKLPVKNHNGKLESKRREYLQLKRQLSRPHRDYLNALIQTHFHFSNAHRIMHGWGYEMDRSTLTRWRQRKDVGRAIDVAQDYIESLNGMSDRSILAQAKRLADHGLDVIPVLNRHGDPVIDPITNKPVERMRDAKLALQATELLGKNRKLWGNEDEKVRVTVQIVDLSGEQTATPGALIDGEFSETSEDFL